MRKTKEQLELLVAMQKHKIDELQALGTDVMVYMIQSNTLLRLETDFRQKIGKAKRKLNHYKQLLENFKKAPVVLMQKFKVGDKVRIKDSWQNSCWFIPILSKYIGLDAVVETVGSDCYRIRTELDANLPMGSLFVFPSEALELVS